MFPFPDGGQAAIWLEWLELTFQWIREALTSIVLPLFVGSHLRFDPTMKYTLELLQGNPMTPVRCGRLCSAMFDGGALGFAAGRLTDCQSTLGKYL